MTGRGIRDSSYVDPLAVDRIKMPTIDSSSWSSRSMNKTLGMEDPPNQITKLKALEVPDERSFTRE